MVDTKQRILDAALAVFGERGYYQASVDEIASRAAVTKGAVYYYFADTADLACDLAHRLLERLKAEARLALDPRRDTITNLKRGFDGFLATLQRLPHARFFLRDCRAIPELNIDSDAERAGSMEMIRSILEAGIERGEIAPLDADALARVLAGACAEAVLHVMTVGQPDGTVAIIHRLIDALAAPGGKVASRGRSAGRGSSRGKRTGSAVARRARAATRRRAQPSPGNRDARTQHGQP